MKPVVALLCFVALLLVGCSSKTDPVGQWSTRLQDVKPPKGVAGAILGKAPRRGAVSLDIKPDKTFQLTVYAQVTGTWEQNGSTVVLTPKTVGGADVQQLKSRLGAFAAIAGDVGEKIEYTLSEDGNTLSNDEATFTRLSG